MVKTLSKNKAILLILALALVMRVVAINQSLWLDEAIGAEAVKNFTYKGLFEHFLKADNHPPLYYLILKLWTGIFGYSEISLRAPSVIFGLTTIFLTYLIAKKLIENKKSLIPPIATLMLATSQIHIYYSQEARMYSMAAFFAVLTIYAFLFIVEDAKKNFYWLIYSVAITALIFTDYVPIFLLPVFPLIGVIRRKNKNWWLKFVSLHVPLLILGILWLPKLLIQAERGSWLISTLSGWKEVAGGATLKQAALVWTKFTFGRISLANKNLYYLFVSLASLPVTYSLYFAWENRKKEFQIIWLWLIPPLVLGFLVSYLFPAFIYFRFLYVLPAFYLAITYGVLNIKKDLVRNIIVFGILGFNVISWLIYVFDVRQQREQWREATLFIESGSSQNEIAIFEYPEPFTPYRWYEKGKIHGFGATDSISADLLKTQQRTKRLVAGKTGLYYFEYLRDLSDPGRVVERTLREEGFSVASIHNFVGVGQVFYWIKE